MKSSELIELPTATKNLLKSKVLQEDKKCQFKKECLVMLVAIVKKLQERSPLQYLVVRSASCLSPLRIVRDKEGSIVRFTSLVDSLYSKSWLSSRDADESKKEYDIFLETVNHEYRDKFLLFDVKTNRVDDFLASFIHGNTKFKFLWNVCKLVFTLSHGQSAVERGFSVNKELLVENLEKESLISQRMVYDHMTATGLKVNEFTISKDLLKSCKLAHSRYTAALQANKNALVSEEKNLKRKLKMEEIANVKEKKKVVESCIETLQIDIEKYSIAAEEKGDLSLLTKANSFRATVKEKKELILNLDMALKNLEEKCKS